MNNQNQFSPRLHLHRYLTVAYLLFIIYASLSPFSGWQDQGLHFIDVLYAPINQTFTWFDSILNCISYLPFGFLLAYMLRNHWSAYRASILSTLAGLSVSVAVEYTQMYLPVRVSSNIDIISNTVGAFCGAITALVIANYTWFSHLKSWHEQWIKVGRSTDFGLALLVAWMFAQVNPSLPMLGSVIVSAISRWPFDIVHSAPFNWLECSEVALNMLLLGVLLSTLVRELRFTLSTLLLVLFIVTVIKFIAAAVLLKSWAVLLWLDTEAMFGIIAGLLMLLAAMMFSHKWLLKIGFLAAILYLVLVVNLILDTSPSAVMRLYHWHYIHMLNYNGLSQVINLAFPVLLLGYLLRARLLKVVK